MRNFKLRKIVHYSLIICILLIQIIIAGFLYNEFSTRKNLTFIENQIGEIHLLEDLTDNSRKELLNSQDYLQKYLVSEDEHYLEAYFRSVNLLNQNLNRINLHTNNPKLRNILNSKEIDSLAFKKMKSLIDSTHQISTQSHYKKTVQLPALKKYNFDGNILDKFEIQTQTYSDTIAKKGIFGRLKDAIVGKENIRKDSTVVTLTQGKKRGFPEIKQEIDSILNAVNHHYTTQINKIQVDVKNNQVETKKDNAHFYKGFINLMVYSNDLMKIYEDSIKESKLQLEKELNQQNSKINKIRTYLVLGLMILMFIVSILIMYFTRMAFIYEWKLNAANEQIKENLSFKNRILGMLSHELRSPLKIIGIFIKRINSKTTDPTVKEYLKSISFTNDTLLIQANQILEYTKNQHLKNQLNPVVFNLKNEINAILTAIQPYIETRNNQFIIHENINPDLMVYSDNIKINQVFMNILGNANKFTENGTITVTTHTEKIDEQTISLVTTMKDNGVGISETDLEKIFEPYYQGILSDEVENLGAGLGLSLCKEIIDLYPGKINVSSKLNKGTTVTFSFYLKINE